VSSCQPNMQPQVKVLVNCQRWRPAQKPCTARDVSPLAEEYARGIAAALDEYQLSTAGGLVAACIIEPVLQVLSCSLLGVKEQQASRRPST